MARSHAPGPQSLALLAYVNEKFGARYNAILVNHYKSGADYISDHSDDERGLDASVGVLVLSAGATRTMAIKRAQKAPPGVPELGKGGFKVEVCNNSVLVMHGETFQTKFSHGMPQRAKGTEPRTSFTFRYHTNKNDAQGIREANATAAFIARKKREREAQVARPRRVHGASTARPGYRGSRRGPGRYLAERWVRGPRFFVNCSSYVNGVKSLVITIFIVTAPHGPASAPRGGRTSRGVHSTGRPMACPPRSPFHPRYAR